MCLVIAVINLQALGWSYRKCCFQDGWMAFKPWLKHSYADKCDSQTLIHTNTSLCPKALQRTRRGSATIALQRNKHPQTLWSSIWHLFISYRLAQRAKGLYWKDSHKSLTHRKNMMLIWEEKAQDARIQWEICGKTTFPRYTHPKPHLGSKTWWASYLTWNILQKTAIQFWYRWELDCSVHMPKPGVSKPTHGGPSSTKI